MCWCWICDSLVAASCNHMQLKQTICVIAVVPRNNSRFSFRPNFLLMATRSNFTLGDTQGVFVLAFWFGHSGQQSIYLGRDNWTSSRWADLGNLSLPNPERPQNKRLSPKSLCEDMIEWGTSGCNSAESTSKFQQNLGHNWTHTCGLLDLSDPVDLLLRSLLFSILPSLLFLSYPKPLSWLSTLFIAVPESRWLPLPVWMPWTSCISRMILFSSVLYSTEVWLLDSGSRDPREPPFLQEKNAITRTGYTGMRPRNLEETPQK